MNDRSPRDARLRRALARQPGFDSGLSRVHRTVVQPEFQGIQYPWPSHCQGDFNPSCQATLDGRSRGHPGSPVGDPRLQTATRSMPLRIPGRRPTSQGPKVAWGSPNVPGPSGEGPPPHSLCLSRGWSVRLGGRDVVVELPGRSQLARETVRLSWSVVEGRSGRVAVQARGGEVVEARHGRMRGGAAGANEGELPGRSQLARETARLSWSVVDGSVRAAC